MANDDLTRESLLEYMQKTGDEVTVQALSYAFGLSSQKVKGLLQKMVRSEDLDFNRGKYTLKSASSLRNQIIRLAYTRPELKADLLPLFMSTRTAREIGTDPELEIKFFMSDWAKVKPQLHLAFQNMGFKAALRKGDFEELKSIVAGKLDVGESELKRSAAALRSFRHKWNI